MIPVPRFSGILYSQKSTRSTIVLTSLLIAADFDRVIWSHRLSLSPNYSISSQFPLCYLEGNLSRDLQCQISIWMWIEAWLLLKFIHIITVNVFISLSLNSRQIQLRFQSQLNPPTPSIALGLVPPSFHRRYRVLFSPPPREHRFQLTRSSPAGLTNLLSFLTTHFDISFLSRNIQSSIPPSPAKLCLSDESSVSSTLSFSCFYPSKNTPSYICMFLSREPFSERRDFPSFK